MKIVLPSQLAGPRIVRSAFAARLAERIITVTSARGDDEPESEHAPSMKIYTKTGDDGETGLFGGPRVRKDAPRIEAYGTVDELNSVIGVARSHELAGEFDAILNRIQNELFDLGAQLATPNPAAHQTQLIGPDAIAALERAIDEFEKRLAPLKQFILPGGTPAAAQLHLARTVCRRAERRLVTLVSTSTEPIAGDLVIYLNRLSDLLFVMARAVNLAAGRADVPWQKPT
jgi:cob(I)alamin adenosyltransferase